MSANFIVYRSRNRLTGTQCVTLDTKHPDSSMPYNPEFRYVVQCVEHNESMSFKEHYFAGRAIAHVDEWCKACQKMLQNKQKVENQKTMNPADLHAAVHNDLRMASHNNAYDKRWTHKPLSKGRVKTTQRTADQKAVYDAEKREPKVAPKVAAKTVTKRAPNTAPKSDA